jgi:hypothetical protein
MIKAKALGTKRRAEVVSPALLAGFCVAVFSAQAGTGRGETD